MGGEIDNNFDERIFKLRLIETNNNLVELINNIKYNWNV